MTYGREIFTATDETDAANALAITRGYLVVVAHIERAPGESFDDYMTRVHGAPMVPVSVPAGPAIETMFGGAR